MANRKCIKRLHVHLLTSDACVFFSLTSFLNDVDGKTDTGFQILKDEKNDLLPRSTDVYLSTGSNTMIESKVLCIEFRGKCKVNHYVHDPIHQTAF